MRTEQEIINRIEVVKNADIFGTVRSDLIHCLPFSSAKKYLKDDVTEDDWEPKLSDDDSVLQEIHDYMEFAWDKANNNRGLSAGRSLMHMQAWLWLLGEDQAADDIDDYSHYGKPQLRAICEHYGWDWSFWDDGRWTNDEMSEGVPPMDAADISWSSEPVAA